MVSKPLICALSLSLLSTFSHSSSSSSSSPTVRHAIAIIHPQNKSECRGLASFSQDSYESSTKILINVIGLKPNSLHGVFISEFPVTEDGEATHFNPYGRKHGGVLDDERHIGDLGNIKSDERGNAFWATKDHLIKLFGEHSILGRGFCVADDKDEGSRSNGNSSKIIGSGVIGLAPSFKNGPPQ